MFNLTPSRPIVKSIGSAQNQASTGGTTWFFGATGNSYGIDGRADFSIGDAREIIGQFRSELAGSLEIFQGFNGKTGPVWTSKTTVAISASTYSAGFVDGSGAAVGPINITGEICKAVFKLTSGGPNNNFELYLAKR